MNALAFSGSNYLFMMLRSSGVDEERKRRDKAVEQLQAGPGNRPSTSTLSMRNFVGRIMLLRRSRMLTLQCRNMRRSPGTTSTPWGPSPSSPTFITRVTARKTARSASSSWGWPRLAWWPTDSPSNAGPYFLHRADRLDTRAFDYSPRDVIDHAGRPMARRNRAAYSGQTTKSWTTSRSKAFSWRRMWVCIARATVFTGRLSSGVLERMWITRRMTLFTICS